MLVDESVASCRLHGLGCSLAGSEGRPGPGVAASRVRYSLARAGRLFCRCRILSWWRSTMISRSFECPERTAKRANDTRNRYRTRHRGPQDRECRTRSAWYDRVSTTHGSQDAARHAWSAHTTAFSGIHTYLRRRYFALAPGQVGRVGRSKGGDREKVLGIRGRSGSTPESAGDDRTGRSAMRWGPKDHQERLPHLEARKAQVLARVLHRLNEPDSSGQQQPEASASSVRHPCAHHAGGIRLLVEEMQKDPEVADALRADLAASLREVAKAHVQSTLSKHDLDDAQQHQLFSTDQYNEALSRASHTLWVREAAHSLQARQSDLTSRFQDAEELLRTLQLSQLKATVVLSVTSPDESDQRGATVRNSVDVADSLEKLREATRELSRSAEILREATREFHGPC